MKEGITAPAVVMLVAEELHGLGIAPQGRD
jgi:hypothetical protein